MTKRAYGWENGSATPQKSRATNVTAQGDEFVQLELSKEQKEELRSQYADIDVLSSALDAMLEGGVKVTLKADNRGNGYVAFGFAAEGSDNAGFILTGRGGSATRALRELAYKHFIVLAGEWSQYHNRASDTSGDDW